MWKRDGWDVLSWAAGLQALPRDWCNTWDVIISFDESSPGKFHIPFCPARLFFANTFHFQSLFSPFWVISLSSLTLWALFLFVWPFSVFPKYFTILTYLLYLYSVWLCIYYISLDLVFSTYVSHLSICCYIPCKTNMINKDFLILSSSNFLRLRLFCFSLLAPLPSQSFNLHQSFTLSLIV